MRLMGRQSSVAHRCDYFMGGFFLLFIQSPHLTTLQRGDIGMVVRVSPWGKYACARDIWPVLPLDGAHVAGCLAWLGAAGSVTAEWNCQGN